MSLDPRCRIGLLFLMGVFLFVITGIPLQVGALVAILLLGKILGFGPRRLWRTASFLRFLIPLTFLLQIFFSYLGNRQSGVETDWLPLGASAVFYTLRITNLVLLMALAFNWIRLAELVDALYHLLNPWRRLRIPVDDLFQVIFIALHFFPEVKIRFQQIYNSFQSFSPPAAALPARLKLIGETIVPVMIVSFRKAELLADAMIMRGYGANPQRTYYGQLNWRLQDTLTLVGAFLLISLGLWWS